MNYSHSATEPSDAVAPCSFSQTSSEAIDHSDSSFDDSSPQCDISRKAAACSNAATQRPSRDKNFRPSDTKVSSSPGAGVESARIRRVLGSVLYRIRFPTMALRTFALNFGRSDVLTGDEKAAIYYYMAAVKWVRMHL